MLRMINSNDTLEAGRWYDAGSPEGISDAVTPETRRPRTGGPHSWGSLLSPTSSSGTGFGTERSQAIQAQH